MDMLRKEVETTQKKLNVDEPQLERRLKVPRQYEQGTAPAEFRVSLKHEYCQMYF